MNTLAPICGVLTLIGYFFYFIVASSERGDDGQGVNQPEILNIENPEPPASEQRGMWE